MHAFEYFLESDLLIYDMDNSVLFTFANKPINTFKITGVQSDPVHASSQIIDRIVFK